MPDERNRSDSIAAGGLSTPGGVRRNQQGAATLLGLVPGMAGECGAASLIRVLNHGQFPGYGSLPSPSD